MKTHSYSLVSIDNEMLVIRSENNITNKISEHTIDISNMFCSESKWLDIQNISLLNQNDLDLVISKLHQMNKVAYDYKYCELSESKKEIYIHYSFNKKNYKLSIPNEYILWYDFLQLDFIEKFGGAQNIIEDLSSQFNLIMKDYDDFE